MGNDESGTVGKGWKRLEIIGRVLIPLAIAVLVFMTDSVSNRIAEVQQDASLRISEAQQELANAQYLSTLEDNRTMLEIKYLEVFYTEISSSDSGRQKLALEILKMLDPELGQKLAQVVAADTNKPRAIRDAATSVARDIGNVIRSDEYREQVENKNNLKRRFLNFRPDSVRRPG